MCYIDLFSASEEFWGHYFIPLQKDWMILLANQQKTSCNHISQCNHYLLLSLKRIVANFIVVLIWGSLILGEFDHFSKYSMCFWTKDTCMFASVCLSVCLTAYVSSLVNSQPVHALWSRVSSRWVGTTSGTSYLSLKTPLER